MALADEVLAAEYVDHTHPDQAPGPESVKEEVLAFRPGFPGAHISIEQMMSEGDIVALRFGELIKEALRVLPQQEKKLF